MKNDTHHELQQLLDELLEGTCTPDQHRRLQELLRADAQARELYVKAMHLHASLAWEHAAAPQQQNDAPAFSGPELHQTVDELKELLASTRRRRYQHWLPWTAVAVSVLLVSAAVLISVSVRSPVQNPGTAEPLVIDQGVAVLARLVDAEWESPDPPPVPGSSLGRTRLALRRGLAQIDFFGGASTILQGPGELELLSPDRARLRRGKLRAHVAPAARGFKIQTDRLDVIDLGTEFAIEVVDQGKAEVHVIDGEVVVGRNDRAPTSAEPVRLTAGQGLEVTQTGSSRTIEAQPQAFVGPEQLASLAESSSRERQQRWLDFSTRWRHDPDTLVYFDFQPRQAWSPTLDNGGTGGRAAPAGAIVGCSWTRGRWPGKLALEFKQISDRVRIDVPGSFESLSLAAWVRIEGLEHRYNSLMLTDGFDKGEVHWQITDTTQVELSVFLGPKAKPRNGALDRDYLSPKLFAPSDLGCWVHLATVYDSQKRVVTHYRDGEPVAALPIVDHTTLRIGHAQIGNWNAATGLGPTVRSFNGLIDELLIIARPLSLAEVQQMASIGKPSG